MLFALVDFYNQRSLSFGGSGRVGRPPNLRDYELSYDALIAGLIAHVEPILNGTIDLRVRLYGGWTTDLSGESSAGADMLSKVLANRGRTRIGRVRITSELATSAIASPSNQLNRMYRTTSWGSDSVNALDDTPADCPQYGTDCTYYDSLKAWVHGRCPNYKACKVKTRLCLSKTSQKMVDTLIVADMIAAVVTGSAVLVVSMDDDMVPGLITAAASGDDVSVIRYGRRAIPGDYDYALMRTGVSVYDYPAL